MPDRDRERSTRRAENAPPDERAVLVGVHLPARFGEELGGPADTEELGLLARTAGARVVGELLQKRDQPEPGTFIGKGKLDELKALAERAGANLAIFDNELSPAQGRNLEKALGLKVIDRTELILDIFARHARTRQARLQVEMAQLQYLLPRLKRLWSHLERQAGGIGTRGPGETQLETDRRLIGRRIAQLKRELAAIAGDREVQRGGRRGQFTAALVGYTNAGKSTLMNALAGADVSVEDRLFATLDAVTRRVEVDERHRFLLTDTVGFIRRLPHHLVESFRATLQEVAAADLLLHVVDAGAADPERQIESVNRVLAELVPEDRPLLLIFNKLDRVEPDPFINHWRRRYPEALFISALEPAGSQTVCGAIVRRMLARERVYRLELPAALGHLLAAFHRTGAVLEQGYENGVCRLAVRMRDEEWRCLLASHPQIRPQEPA